jgi:Lrp/AsnC family leucine-responsive transcriptional regulator
MQDGLQFCHPTDYGAMFVEFVCIFSLKFTAFVDEYSTNVVCRPCPNRHRHTTKEAMASNPTDLDRTDLKILTCLQEDGRVSNLKLAETVALSPTAVLARVQRLTKDGYILGYEARLNPLKLGAGMMVFVEVLLDRTTPNVFEAFKAAVQVRGEIMECHMVAGGFDYLLKTRMADMAAYRDFAGTVLWQLPGVRETRTYPVMEEVKNTTQLTLF